VEAYYNERLNGNKDELRRNMTADSAELEHKMHDIEVDGAASMCMLKKQDLDHDHKISWDEYLNYRAWMMRLQGRLNTRLVAKQSIRSTNDGTNSLTLPSQTHSIRRRSSGNEASSPTKEHTVPSIPLLGFATPPDTARSSHRHKHRSHRHHRHHGDHAIDAEPTPRFPMPSGGLIPSLPTTTSNASVAGTSSMIASPPSPDKERRKSSHRSRRHHSSKEKDTNNTAATTTAAAATSSTVGGVGSLKDDKGEHKEKEKRKKSKSKERRHRSRERRHRSKERGNDTDSKQATTVLPPVL
jgi:hypothetical protein